ncbi:MAG: helix-turn-helix transcriptional regulator [Clostridia bacterium]|nr:helix-turn-helix transcriptional regulator [Clostridia bacterium]
MSKQIDKYKSSLQYDKDYYIEKRFIKAGEYFAPHWHDYFELEFILDGCGEHIYNNTKYTLSRGSIYLMSFYDFHELTAKTDMNVLKLQFNENVLPNGLNDFLFLSRNRFCCAVDENETMHIIKLFDILKREENGAGLFSEMLIKNLIAEIIITVIRNSAQDENTVVPTLLQNAVAYIHNNFREQITLNGLARYCNVTPNYLGAQFSKKMGISFSDYLNTVRLRYACNLLDGTNLSCKEIAFACGYNSVEHFVYTFKKKLNCTPIGYRKKSI